MWLQGTNLSGSNEEGKRTTRASANVKKLGLDSNFQKKASSFDALICEKRYSILPGNSQSKYTTVELQSVQNTAHIVSSKVDKIIKSQPLHDDFPTRRDVYAKEGN